MCTFMKTADLPSHNAKGQSTGKSFTSYFLKPNKENEQYRLRLVWYRQPTKNDRTEPYFVQQVHDHWGMNDKGHKIVDDTIVCPSTKYVKYDDEKYIFNEKLGKKTINCPICRKANEAMAAYRASGKLDKIAMQRFNSLKSKFRACIPVYVIDDPNAWDKDHERNFNNGKLKVLILTNKDEYERFDKLVRDEKTKAYLSSKEGRPYEVFNGDNAVDLFIRMETVPEVRYAGTPKEYIANVRKITQMAFGRKAYNIPQITKELIDAFDFDDKFYVSNTKSELNEFYNKHYGQENSDVPQEDINDVFASTKAPEKAVSVENTVKTAVESETKHVDEEIDSILGGEDVTEMEPEGPAIVEAVAKNAPEPDGGVSDTEIDDILDGLE
jgi:hypothetical protein